MEEVTVTRVIRPVRLERFADIHQPRRAAPTVRQPRPPPRKNNGCPKIFLLSILYFFGVSSIALGVMHLNDCPAEKTLPKGLVIFGGMLLVSLLLNCVYDFRSVCEEDCSKNTLQCLQVLNLLFCMAGFCMFIALCYYVFNVDPATKPEDHALKNYCGIYKTVYVGCIIGLIIFGLVFISCCCLIVCFLLGVSAHYKRPIRRCEARDLK